MVSRSTILVVGAAIIAVANGIRLSQPEKATRTSIDPLYKADAKPKKPKEPLLDCDKEEVLGMTKSCAKCKSCIPCTEPGAEFVPACLPCTACRKCRPVMHCVDKLPKDEKKQKKERASLPKCSRVSLMAEHAAKNPSLHSPALFKTQERFFMEGGTDENEFKEEQKAVQEVNAKNICQTGFNAGVSALAFLCSADDTKVFSYDIGQHNYVHTGRAYMDANFPGRHRLTIGDSTKTLKQAIEDGGVGGSSPPCDLAFVDGGHTEEIAFADITNFARLTKAGGRLLIDNCNIDGKSRGYGGHPAVSRAYQHAIKEGYVKHVRQVSTGCSDKELLKDKQLCRELCIGTYLPGTYLDAWSPTSYKAMQAAKGKK